MHSTTPLTAIGVLTLGLLVAVAAQLSYPDQMLQQPMWPTDTSLMLRLQESQATKAPAKESKTSLHLGHVHLHAYGQCDHAGYRSPGKPGAEVTLASAPVQTLPLGTVETVELALASSLPPGTVRVALAASEGLALVGADREWQFSTSAGQPIVLPIHVQAATEGQHHVHLFVEHIDGEGTRSARALAAEFRVGGGSLEKAFAKSFSTAVQSEFSSLPAREVIY